MKSLSETAFTLASNVYRSDLQPAYVAYFVIVKITTIIIWALILFLILSINLSYVPKLFMGHHSCFGWQCCTAGYICLNFQHCSLSRIFLLWIVVVVKYLSSTTVIIVRVLLKRAIGKKLELQVTFLSKRCLSFSFYFKYYSPS